MTDLQIIQELILQGQMHFAELITLATLLVGLGVGAKTAAAISAIAGPAIATGITAGTSYGLAKPGINQREAQAEAGSLGAGEEELAQTLVQGIQYAQAQEGSGGPTTATEAEGGITPPRPGSGVEELFGYDAQGNAIWRSLDRQNAASRQGAPTEEQLAGVQAPRVLTAEDAVGGAAPEFGTPLTRENAVLNNSSADSEFTRILGEIDQILLDSQAELDNTPVDRGILGDVPNRFDIDPSLVLPEELRPLTAADAVGGTVPDPASPAGLTDKDLADLALPQADRDALDAPPDDPDFLSAKNIANAASTIGDLLSGLGGGAGEAGLGGAFPSVPSPRATQDTFSGGPFRNSDRLPNLRQGYNVAGGQLVPPSALAQALAALTNPRPRSTGAVRVV